MLRGPERFSYSPISQRPKYTWRDGRKLALYVTVNVEHFPFGEQGGPDLDRPTQPWSQRSWLWREYGNRVGAWRLMDLFDDEQPFWVKAKGAPLLAMPYPIELNDQPAVVYRRNTGAEYAEMLVDNFDEMLRKSEDAPLVYAISIHTFILGQPYRLARFRRALQHMLGHADKVWFAMPKEICSHYVKLPREAQLHAS